MATVDITETIFEKTLKNNDIVIVDFWASWCGPCRSFAPTYKRVSEKHPDIVFAKINTEEEQELAAHFKIRSIPTLMVFREEIMLYQNPGMLSAGQLENIITQVKEIDMKKVHEDIQDRPQA